MAVLNIPTMITPITQDWVTPELLAKIELARQQIRNGEYTRCRTWEESKQFLDSL